MRPRVYCAGPLFNPKEREEMEELARHLKMAGFDTFLPQRDGLELTKVMEFLIVRGVAPTVAGEVTSKAVFALDVYQVLVDCAAIVVNLNGRVPDEGAVSEAAIAWSRGKLVVGYKTDSRSVFLGQDNPLVTGLFDFQICSSCEEAVERVRQALAGARDEEEQVGRRNAQLAEYLNLGNRIWSAAKGPDKMAGVVEVLVREFREMSRAHASPSTRAAV
jgi:nucleoside 2-deoxyribosyltransferase